MASGFKSMRRGFSDLPEWEAATLLIVQRPFIQIIYGSSSKRGNVTYMTHYCSECKHTCTVNIKQLPQTQGKQCVKSFRKQQTLCKVGLLENRWVLTCDSAHSSRLHSAATPAPHSVRDTQLTIFFLCYFPPIRFVIW